MWINGVAADPGATAEYMRAMKEKLCIYVARSVQIVCILNFICMFGLCVIPRLTVSLLPVCMSFLECWPFLHFVIIAYIYRSWYKSRSGSLHWKSLTKIILLLLLCSSLSINLSKKGLGTDLDTVLGPKFPNDKTCSIKWQDNDLDNTCTLNWLENDPTPFGEGGTVKVWSHFIILAACRSGADAGPEGVPLP